MDTGHYRGSSKQGAFDFSVRPAAPPPPSPKAEPKPKKSRAESFGHAPFYFTASRNTYIVSHNLEFLGSITRSGKVDFMYPHGRKRLAEQAVHILVDRGWLKPGTVATSAKSWSPLT